jgi:hypothetical protein
LEQLYYGLEASVYQNVDYAVYELINGDLSQSLFSPLQNWGIEVQAPKLDWRNSFSTRIKWLDSRGRGADVAKWQTQRT